MTLRAAKEGVTRALTPKYAAGEAAAIARIVMEDVFFSRKRPESSLLDEAERTQLAHITQRLLAGEPLQYILGEADFFGLKFKVGPAVLIPRQETEELVAWVLEHLNARPHMKPRLLDIGLGSGCIGLTLKAKWPALQLFGVEKSPEALEIAQTNAQHIGIDAGPSVFFLADILDRAQWPLLPAADIVVSNPPYITRAESALMPEHVLAHEPPLALFVDGTDALLFYRAIADFVWVKCPPDAVLFFECNEFNAREVAAMLHEKGFSNVQLRQDLSGADRMLFAKRTLLKQ